MGAFVPNQGGINNVLHGPAGPVYRAVVTFANVTERVGKATAGNDTGQLRQSITSSSPNRSARGLSVRVGSSIRHAKVNHQGHGYIYAKAGRPMQFYWKKKGRVTSLNTVSPVAGTEFLFHGMHAAQAFVSPSGATFRVVIHERAVGGTFS